uniref:Death domain-containing protein n=1 Tax=Amphimedon queenslandica TaxID=400682 RepID=A0A1X7ST60_AMPQE
AVEKEPGCTLVIVNPATHSNTTGQDPDYVNSTANPLYDLVDKDDSVFHDYVNVDICVQNSNEVIYDNLINRADEHIYENTAINQENTNNESVDGAGEDENEPTVEVHVHVEQHGDESSTDLPELEPTHLVNVFLNSDITVGTLNTLRVMLQVSRARLPSDNSLAMQAMEVISAWVDEHPEISLQEKHRILADHLRSLELNYLIPKLRGEERFIGADPQGITNYLRDVTRTFSTSQAREFGRSLKLSKKKIETISRSTGATTGMELVLQIFDHVNRNNTHLNGPLMSEIEESPPAAAKLNTNPTRGTLRKYHNRLGTSQY